MDPPPAGPLTGYLGMDMGSTSTNVVVIDEDMRVLSRQVPGYRRPPPGGGQGGLKAHG